MWLMIALVLRNSLSLFHLLCISSMCSSQKVSVTHTHSVQPAASKSHTISIRNVHTNIHTNSFTFLANVLSVSSYSPLHIHRFNSQWEFMFSVLVNEALCDMLKVDVFTSFIFIEIVEHETSTHSHKYHSCAFDFYSTCVEVPLWLGSGDFPIRVNMPLSTCLDACTSRRKLIQVY